MDAKHFFHACELINNNLVNQVMNRTFNSIGSNVFFEFGQDKEVIFKNGRKSTQKEWAIWVSHASWRITKYEKYIVGSGETLEVNIQSYLEQLLGKRFRSFQFVSQFLDVQFNFEDGYQITTFFNSVEEDQWLLFLPDEFNINIDCSSQEAIQNVQDIAEHISIIETYKKIDFPQQDILLTKITYDKCDLPTLYFENDTSINLENCTWRLEKGKDYLVGYLDDKQNKFNKKISELIGKKLKKIDVANSMMDARLQFNNDYTLKTFTCCRKTDQWKICSNTTPLFRADIQICE